MATVDAAGCGERPRSAADEQARADLRRAMRAGEPVDEIFESLIGPLVDNAVPEWQTTLDALLELQPPATGPGPVRRLRQRGEDAARESGRAHRHPWFELEDGCRFLDRHLK
ncbi:hypothetical protein HNR57_006188 [Streptomyces paradoxus]|uniref:Uncharacterized protein n=1 Tax=Streptomyces paradoxus TaxID=66375 RepID=A0A7W9WKE8_9ACTN|nr:hypothetical protein [Streptomyces paradoxus]